jgi:hypothetical protein
MGMIQVCLSDQNLSIPSKIYIRRVSDLDQGLREGMEYGSRGIRSRIVDPIVSCTSLHAVSTCPT